MNKNFKRGKKRGISSVVGAVFMVLVMVGALNLTLWTMQQQNSVTQAIIERSNSDLSKLNERIEIKDVRLTTSNRLNITVANAGGSAAQLASMYIVNETASPKQQFKYDLGAIVDGRDSKTVGTNLPFTVKDLTQYSIRIVTKAGNTAAITIGSLSTSPLRITMFVIPPTLAPGGGNVTVIMSVTNNYTDTVFPRGISANMAYSGACTPTLRYPCTVNLVQTEGNNTLIARGSTALYKWIYNINSPDGTVYIFTGKIVNGVPSNTATAKVTLKLLDSNNSSNTDVVSLKFLNTVGISVILPGPYGISNSKGYWGVVVSNPTSNALNVSRIAITAISPALTSSDAIFKQSCASGTDYTAVAPSSGAWTCPADNQIQWKAASGSPITISGFASQSFIIFFKPNSINSPEIPAALVTATAFTTYGQFSKSGYSINMVKGPTGSAVVNTYGSTKDNNSTSTSDILGHINGWHGGTTKILNFTLTNLDSSGSKQINSGAKLIINLPPQWTFDLSYLKYGGFNVPKINTVGDGSAQLIATRYSVITGAGSTVGGTISVKVVAPVVTDDRIYIISVTCDGDVNTPSGYNIGAIAEFPVQVLKN